MAAYVRGMFGIRIIEEEVLCNEKLNIIRFKRDDTFFCSAEHLRELAKSARLNKTVVNTARFEFSPTVLTIELHKTNNNLY